MTSARLHHQNIERRILNSQSLTFNYSDSLIWPSPCSDLITNGKKHFYSWMLFVCNFKALMRKTSLIIYVMVIVKNRRIFLLKLEPSEQQTNQKHLLSECSLIEGALCLCCHARTTRMTRAPQSC